MCASSVLGGGVRGERLSQPDRTRGFLYCFVVVVATAIRPQFAPLTHPSPRAPHWCAHPHFRDTLHLPSNLRVSLTSHLLLEPRCCSMCGVWGLELAILWPNIRWCQKEIQAALPTASGSSPAPTPHPHLPPTLSVTHPPTYLYPYFPPSCLRTCASSL